MNGIIREKSIGKGSLVYRLFGRDTNGVTQYGVEITSTLFSNTPETEKVFDITADISEAHRFFDLISENLVLPCTLRDITTDYIDEFFTVKS